MKKLITTITIVVLCIAGLKVSAQTDTLFYTGSVQTITVPPCVTSMMVDISGAQGGSNSNLTGAPSFATGGLGGRVIATIPVVAGSVLQVNVGGRGLSDSANHSCILATGGFNGGGLGYGGYNGDSYNAGGGGGASDIRVSPYAFANVLVVAGGGGGAGCSGCTGGGVDGGAGGGLTGGNGFGQPCASNKDYGQGGTQVKGGDSGTFWSPGSSGSFGMGGTSMVSGSGVTCGGGGGGGGGYYGGGGGSLAGGGGGSSYTVPSATGVTHTQGYHAGNGYVIITFTGGSGHSIAPVTGPTVVCQGMTYTYSCDTASGSTFNWTVPAGTVINSGQGTDTIHLTFGSTAGTIKVVATEPCGMDSATLVVTNVNLKPALTLSAAKDTICVNNNKDSLIVSPIGGTLSGTGVVGSNFNPTLAGAGSHKVYYSYTDTNGCTNTDSLLIQVNVCAGINEVSSLDGAVKIYPNPFTDEVNLNVEVDGPLSVSMFNILGENVSTWKLNKGLNLINTQGIAPGVYTLKIYTQFGVLNKKLVKVN